MSSVGIHRTRKVIRRPLKPGTMSSSARRMERKAATRRKVTTSRRMEVRSLYSTG